MHTKGNSDSCIQQAPGRKRLDMAKRVLEEMQRSVDHVFIWIWQEDLHSGGSYQHAER